LYAGLWLEVEIPAEPVSEQPVGISSEVVCPGGGSSEQSNSDQESDRHTSLSRMSFIIHSPQQSHKKRKVTVTDISP